MAPTRVATAPRWGSDVRRLVTVGGLLAALVLWLVATAPAAEWSTISPGISTMDAVRAQFGAPSKTESQKTDGYDTASWTYEAARAPAGLRRAVVDFGLLTPQGFRADLVRSLRLDPKPGAFNRVSIVGGWGQPTRTGREGGAEVFFYAAGLLVYFEPDGWTARLLVFTPPQPPPAAQSAPK